MLSIYMYMRATPHGLYIMSVAKIPCGLSYSKLNEQALW